MLDDLELIQGAVLRQIVVGASTPVRLTPLSNEGRINTFIVNENVGVHVKHSTKRMSPWLFTFHVDQLAELIEMQKKHKNSFVALVCGTDGIATLDMATLQSLINFGSSEQAWVRVSRARRSMYGISGNYSDLSHKVAHGVSVVHSALER
jgi:hypothetical protein